MVTRNLKQFRERILFLDGYQCRNPHCPRLTSGWEPKFTILSAHHILSRSQGGAEEDDNGITLCAVCHEYAEGRGNLRDENGHRVSGRRFVYNILCELKDKVFYRWEKGRKYLENLVEKREMF